MIIEIMIQPAVMFGLPEMPLHKLKRLIIAATPDTSRPVGMLEAPLELLLLLFPQTAPPVQTTTRALILGRVSIEEARATHHDRGMLIDNRHIDPDMPNPEHIIKPQVGMVIQAMIEPAMTLALHGMP